MLLLRTAALLLLALASAAAVYAQSEPVTLKMATTDVGLLVTVDVGGKAVLLLVDTGALYTHLDAKHLRLPRSKRKMRTMTGSGTAELSILEPVLLSIGARRFDAETLDIDLAAQRKACGCDVAGVIGLDVLRRFAVVEFRFADAPAGSTLQFQESSKP